MPFGLIAPVFGLSKAHSSELMKQQAARSPAPPDPAPLDPRNTLNKDRGSPTTFNQSNQYNVTSTSYPEDLMDHNDRYGGNYVIFYINVQEDSKLLQTATLGSAQVDPSSVPPRLRGDAIALGQAGGVGVGTAITALTAQGAITGGVIGKAFGLSGTNAAVVGGLTGAISGTGLASQTQANPTSAPNFSRRTKRLQQAIALYVPEDINIKYSMDWETEETALISAAFVGSDALQKSLKASDSKQALSAVDVQAATLALNTPGSGGYLSSITGLAPNPKKEQIFKGVKYREFDFTYRFFPRTPQEAENVKNIIQAFKLHMHPEFKDQYNFLYIYPSEFDIYYYKDGKENPNLHRHTSVVLTDLAVNYAPQGIYTTFEDGMPTQINITLSFKELALLTKDQILDGF
jgi:hypothetical protein